MAYLESKGAITLRINRPGIKEINHISETDLDDVQFNYMINNDGSIEDLKEKVIIWLKNLKLLK